MTVATPASFQALNTIGTTLCPPAPPPWNHRPGGAYYGGYLLFATPRMNTSNNFYYLDLQYNAVQTTATADGTIISGVDQGVTCGVRPGDEAIPARMMARLESFTPGGVPWMIWAEMPLDPGSTISPVVFYYNVPQFPGGGDPPVIASVMTPIASFPGAPTEALVDFTTASLGGKVFMMWVVPSDAANVWYTTFDGMQTTEAAILMSIDPSLQIVSIDATTVMTVDEQNNPSASIAVVALSTDNATVPKLHCTLVNPLTGAAPQTIPMPVPVLGSTPQSAIRVTWGSLPQADGNPPVKNGLILHYVAAGLVHQIVAGNDLGTYGGPSYLNIVDISPGQGYPSQDWVDVTPSSLYGADLAFTCASMSALFPITIVDPTGNALVSLGVCAEILIPILMLTELDNFYFQTLPSFKLTQQAPIIDGTTVESGYDEGTITSIVSSWELLGIITGLPPYVQGQNGVSVTYGRATDFSQKTTLTSDQTLTLGATLLDASMSVAIAASNAVASGTDVDLSVSLTFSTDSTPPASPTHGWFIILQPTYARYTYVISNVAGVSAGPTITILTITNGTTALIALPFDLTAPNTPLDPSLPELAILCQFPTGSDGSPIVSWPASNDMNGWLALPIGGTAYSQWLQLWQAQELPNQPELISVGDNGYNETLTFTNSQDNTFQNTVTIKTGTDIAISVFQFSVEGELSIGTEVETNFTTSYQFVLSYGPLDGVQEQLQIQPKLYQPSAAGAPWLPKLMSQQQPWMLTWRVINFG